MVDAKTGKVTEYKMPNPKAKDPHTIAFLRDGRIFFTVQAGNFVGTLDPKVPGGAIKLIESPTLNSRPYGVRLDSKGVPYFDEFNSNKIGSMDPKTMVIREYELPAKGARPRRIAIGKDDTVWYGDYARGFLGHLDPKTGKVEEFQSPGGPESMPYAIDVTADGAIWYVETGDDQKNVLVRFNPETKKFLTWPVPGGGGTVRNMDIDKNGNLWLAESGVGKIARVKIIALASEEGHEETAGTAREGQRPFGAETRNVRALRFTCCCRLNVLAPGWVPEMNASWIEPGVSAGSTEPLPLSTARKTMLPGAANSGGSSLSGLPSM